MFPVNSEKRRAERFVECLASGSPIGPVRTVDEMLSLAGACFLALLTHGPIWRKTLAKVQGRTLAAPQTPEHIEADDQTIFADLHAAVEFVAHLTMLVHDHQYDDNFAGKVACLVTQAGGKKKVIPVEGFKSRG